MRIETGIVDFARRIGEPPFHGAPMPSDARVQVLAIASKLQHDQSEPAAVKGSRKLRGCATQVKLSTDAVLTAL